MVNYKPPVQIEADVTTGFVSGTNVVVFDGSGGKMDWRGLKIIPSQPGTGHLIKGRDYDWNSASGTWTHANDFAPNQFFHIEFELLAEAVSYAASSGGPLIQYPHDVKVKVSNSISSTSVTTEFKGRCELGANAKKGFNVEDQSLTPKAIIYLPLPFMIVNLEDHVEVYEGSRLLVADRVKQFSKGQLNARIWL